MRDAVLLNAAGALVAFDGVAAGPPTDLHAALAVGRWPGRRQAVDSGAAEELLARWVELSTGCGGRRHPADAGAAGQDSRPTEKVGLGVGPRPGAEGDVGVGAAHPVDLAEPARDDVRQLLVPR